MPLISHPLLRLVMLLPLGFPEVLATVLVLVSPLINQLITDNAVVIEEMLIELFLGSADNV